MHVYLALVPAKARDLHPFGLHSKKSCNKLEWSGQFFCKRLVSSRLVLPWHALPLVSPLLKVCRGTGADFRSERPLLQTFVAPKPAWVELMLAQVCQISSGCLATMGCCAICDICGPAPNHCKVACPACPAASRIVRVFNVKKRWHNQA